jgi:hypothetical protein
MPDKDNSIEEVNEKKAAGIRKRWEDKEKKEQILEDDRSSKRFDFDCFKPYKLAAKQKEFVVTFMNPPYLGNRSFRYEVYKKVYNPSSDNACKANCTALMNKSKIKEAMVAYQVHSLKNHKTEVTTETIENLRRRANYPISVFYNKDGTCKTLDNIPDEWHICIDNIKIDKKSNAGKGIIETKEYILCNRDKARQDLVKMLGVFQEMEKIEVSVPSGKERNAIDSVEDKEINGGPRIVLNMSVGNPSVKKE